MRLPRTVSLSGYMISTIILVHVFLAPILYTQVLNIYKTSSSEMFMTHTNNLAGILANDLSSNDNDLHSKSIVSILDSAALSGDIIFIDIINPNKESFNTSDPLQITSDEFIEDSRLNQNKDNIYFISVPVDIKSNTDGSYTLRLGFDESTYSDQIHSIQDRFVFIFLFYIAAMVSVFTLITHYIHKPLKLLRQKSTTIAQGDVDFPLNVPTYITDIKDLSYDLEKMRLTLLKMANNMQIQATHDELTNLPNRYLYTDRMHQAVSMAHRTGQKFAVLLLDLDRFKEINDTLGHGFGDKVLTILANRMHDGMRESDTISRIGGDEFSFILINVNQEAAKVIAKKIIQIIEPIILIDGHSINVSASIGISLYPSHGNNPELLLQHADVAMYHAKNNNKNIAVYEKEMDSDNYDKLMMVNDFKSSIAQNHFQSVFQPKMDLQTFNVSGCEMLLRWQHPYLGLINPDMFIPLAEQENIISELTRWAASECLSQFLPILKSMPDFNVSINVSPVSLLDSKLLDSLLSILEISQFPAKNLIIEITENVIMKNPERSAQILNLFSDAGMKISIDDFGTGYSSLAYLQKFPIAELKIDKTFITDLTKDSTNYPIVKASIALAHDLGISVVAEGIESKEVHSLLVDLKCDRVQGFHYAKPMSFQQLEKWLSEENRSEAKTNLTVDISTI